MTTPFTPAGNYPYMLAQTLPEHCLQLVSENPVSPALQHYGIERSMLLQIFKRALIFSKSCSDISFMNTSMIACRDF